MMKITKNKSFIILMSVFVVIVLVILFKVWAKEYPVCDTGKYLNYIEQAKEENEKELKKNKIENSYISYENVIFESEKEKAELSLLNDNDIVAEYLVCLVSETDDENIEKYYMCKVPYVKYKNTLNDQLEIAKDFDYQSIMNDSLKTGTDIAGAVADVNSSKKKAEKSIFKSIGRAVGGFIGDRFGAKKGGEQIGEYVGGIAPSVIEGVKSIGSNIINQFNNNNIKLNEFINAMPEEDYKATLNDFSSIMKSNIETVSKNDLGLYLSEKEIALLNKTLKKFKRK